MVRQVVEQLGKVQAPNIDFQICKSFRKLVHHVGHQMKTWRPCRKSATCGTLTAFYLTLCRSLHEGVEVCSGLGLHEADEAAEIAAGDDIESDEDLASSQKVGDVGDVGDVLVDGV